MTALHITGASRFSEADLIAATGFRRDETADLSDLRVLAQHITDYYAAHGYFLARAYVPAQDLTDGSVTLAVVEGRYGAIRLENRAPVSDRLARGTLAGLDPGDLVQSAPLERRLLLLQDLPGVNVRSTLAPGEAVGTSDLTVGLDAGRRVTGDVMFDNAGNRYTGAYRGGGTITFNEPTGQGDAASVRVLTSGSGLNYVRAAYETRLGDATVGLAYAHLDYRLKRLYAPLHARGTVETASLFASYPLIRSQMTNLYVSAQGDARDFIDKVGATGSRTKRSTRLATLGLSGDHRDTLWGGGWTSFAADGSVGDLKIRSEPARSIDDLTARSNGRYEKLSLQLSRLQSLGGDLSLYADARGQIASRNLDSSEKMELGGAYGVRAYPEGEAFGDEGYILSLEARLGLPALTRPAAGQVQAFAFVDSGWVRTNHTRWVAGPNERQLSAAGVGLNWFDRHGLNARVSYAFRLGDDRAQSAPDRSGRIWFQISKYL